MWRESSFSSTCAALLGTPQKHHVQIFVHKSEINRLAFYTEVVHDIF